MGKKYTVPLSAAQLKAAAVGNIFMHHGVKMRITRIGIAYVDADDKAVFDTWAVPADRPLHPTRRWMAASPDALVDTPLERGVDAKLAVWDRRRKWR
jgi:hypothetical protein